MSEDHEDTQEGWEAPARAPLVAMAMTTIVLAIALVGGGHVYRRTLGLAVHVAPPLLPAPRLETVRTAPGDRRPDRHEPAPARLSAAMAATAAEGDALWGRARP